jgi:hypothetical protein
MVIPRLSSPARRSEGQTIRVLDLANGWRDNHHRAVALLPGLPAAPTVRSPYPGATLRIRRGHSFPR